MKPLIGGVMDMAEEREYGVPHESTLIISMIILFICFFDAVESDIFGLHLHYFKCPF